MLGSNPACLPQKLRLVKARPMNWLIMASHLPRLRDISPNCLFLQCCEVIKILLIPLHRISMISVNFNASAEIPVRAFRLNCEKKLNNPSRKDQY